MRPVPLNKVRYKDNLAKKRQRRFLATLSLIILVSIFIVGLAAYIIFFSQWFDVRSVQIDGLAGAKQKAVQSQIDQQLVSTWHGIPTGKNELFFPVSKIKNSLASQYSFIQDINIKRKFLHGLIIDVTERSIEGIWCFASNGDCYYFDHDGVLTNIAPQSSGFLTLTINDLRVEDKAIDKKFLSAVEVIVPGLDAQGIKTKDVTIPAGTFTELDINTSNGYPIKFSTDSDIVGQLKALGIFRKQHKDPNPPYQYLDARFDGRIYYK